MKLINFEKIYIFCADKDHIILYKKNSYIITATEKKGHRDEPWIYPVFNVTSSSYLTETLNGKQVSYPPENIRTHDVTKSWVEGVEGFGKGERISFGNCGNGSRKIYIINGFFSPDKPSLFYDNNRMHLMKLLSHLKMTNLYQPNSEN